MDIEALKNIAGNKQFIHGVATLKEPLIRDGKVVRQVGETGVITAFLPDIDKYAVMFDGKMGVDNWFSMDKESFNKFFNYTLEENHGRT